MIPGAVLLAALSMPLSFTGPRWPTHALPEAAQRLAMGDLPHALALLPDADQALLVQGYGDAFHIVLYILGRITVLSAATVFGFLTHRSARDDAHADAPPLQDDMADDDDAALSPAMRKAVR